MVTDVLSSAWTVVLFGCEGARDVQGPQPMIKQ
jgi:hypothetical protein